MKIRKFLTALCVLQLLSGLPGLPLAQQRQEFAPNTERGFTVSHLRAGQSLLQNTITCVLQDRTGFLWIGTQEGLIRYDGYNMREYRHDPQDDHSLSHDAVQAIYEDHTGLLWVGTRDGLNAFNPRTDQFRRYDHDPNDPSSLSFNSVSAIYEDRSRVLWIGTDGRGLNRFDRQTGRFAHYTHDADDSASINSNFIRALFEDQSGALWIGTLAQGLNRFDRQTERFTRYRHNPDDPHSLSHDAVWTIYEDRAETLWIGTFGGGLNRFDRKTEQFVVYRYDPQNPHSLSHDRVLAIVEDHDGRLWIGTQGGGLNRFHRPTERFESYQTNPAEANSLSHNIVSALYEGRAGILWIGTEGGGLNKLVHETKLFRHYSFNSIVLALAEDQDEMLWIGTYGKGVLRFNAARNRLTHYAAEPDDPHALSDDIVLSIEEDRDGALWFGTKNGGLNRFNRSNRSFVRYQHDPDDPHSVSHNTIRTLYADRTGTLWVGTQGGGLNWFDPDAEQFVHFRHDPDDPHSLNHDDVWVIYEDAQGLLWIGTDGGFDRFDRAARQFVHYPMAPVRALHQDQTGALWIGARGSGLLQFDQASETPAAYTAREGLPGDVIYAIVEDGQGYLWLSTDRNGLARFDPPTETCTNFDVSDGLQSNFFNAGAVIKNRRGELLFGGLTGVTVFHPHRIRSNPHVPPIVLTDVQVSDHSVPIGPDSPLQQAISYADTITLPHYQNVLTFEFAALDYTAPEKNRYAYRLEGIDPDWVQAGTQRVATYQRIPPGAYTLRVKGSNNDNIWNDDGASLKILIRPPWWAALWFRSTLTLLLVGLAFGSYRWRVSALKARSRELETQVAERTDHLWHANAQLQQEITERRKAEEQLRFQAMLLTQIQDAVVATDLEGRITYVNETVCQTLHKSQDELLGQNIYVLGEDPLLGATQQEILEQTLANGAWTGRVVNYDASGNPSILETRTWMVYGANGKATGMVGISTDVSAKVQAEQTLQQAKDEAEAARRMAEQANQAKSVFLANMSHELRTPLNTILGFSEIMARTPRSQEEQENFAIMQRSGAHLLTLINQVLDLSKIEAGRITLNERDFDLYALLEELEDMFRLQAQQKDLTLEFSRSAAIPRFLHADEVKLRQVLINVIGNAVKFTATGRVSVRVSEFTEFTEFNESPAHKSSSNSATHQFSNSPTHKLCFEIEDTGPGMTTDELDSLFEAFTQTRTGQQTEGGTGLGLPISQKFVQLMGGNIQVESQTRVGTTMRFTIQAAEAITSRADRDRGLRRVIGMAPGQPRYRLLSVDDNADNRRVLLQFLQPFVAAPGSDEGFELREASNGLEALTLWRQWSPHLIWMDLRMPGLDGYETTRQIRAAEHGQSVKIIVLSASSFEDEREVALARGCDDFLRKPIREAQVFEMLHRHLGVRFLYEEQLSPAAATARQTPRQVLTPEALAALPPDVLAALRRAAEILDAETIRDLLVSITQHDATLAQAVEALLAEYRFDVLLELLNAPGGLNIKF